jgi:putative intracellular protease/amidase
MHILMVVTSHGDIDGEPATGVWFSEFSEPFAVFGAAGARITVASPRGGPAPVDPRGYPSAGQIAGVRDALERLNATHRLDHMAADDFDALFLPGGHGPMFDLATDAVAKALIAAVWEAGKPVGAVCHGPAALLGVTLSDGATLLSGRRVTALTEEEDAVDPLFAHMPFSLQARIVAEGGRFVARPPRAVHSQTDGRLVTGQNPASAEATARAFLAAIETTRP